MSELQKLFESENIRIAFDDELDKCGRVLIASRDRGSTRYERWVYNNLSMDNVRQLRDKLDELLNEKCMRKSGSKAIIQLGEFDVDDLENHVSIDIVLQKNVSRVIIRNDSERRFSYGVEIVDESEE